MEGFVNDSRMRRQVEYELPGTMAREKRGLEPGGAEGDLQPEPKRPRVPALATVIVEALKVDSLQKICSSLEPILRRVVSEEVERALAKLGAANIGGRLPAKRIEGPDARNLQLQFRTRLSLPLFTGGKVEGEQGAAIHAVLFDANSGQIVTSGPESSAKLDILVLEGDFNNEDDEDWTEEEFESHVVKEREGKRPLLTGDLQVTLKEGVGTLGELTFTDNSSWIRSRKFRLGLKIASGFCEGLRILEAKTEPFTVKDHRGELYKKHYPPALTDEVWRLEKIGKDGSFHRKLTRHGIHTVEDFLKLVVKDPQCLRNILGSGMSNKMWEILVEHAKTCVLSGKYYIYYDDTKSIGAIFNNIYAFCGLIVNEQFFTAEDLNDRQKVFADTLVKKAYDNWMNVIEYDVMALLDSSNRNKETASINEAAPGSANYHASYDQQASEMNSLATVPLVQPAVDLGITIRGGYNDNHAMRYPDPSQHIHASNNHVDYASTSFLSENQLAGSSHHTQVTTTESTCLALTPPQPENIGFLPLSQSTEHSNINMNIEWSRQPDNHSMDDYFQEEVQLRSHEILENNDMQHLLRAFSMGGASASDDAPEDGYSFPSFMPSPRPNFDFDDDRKSSSGKAVVGWLKIKAAMRWGIFVRKKAAEKRAAQLVELEDD